ncbi:MAG: hypothetical protein K2W97_00015 [Chthoniobacterales bacterium]|nr:hypothetical protein [Chthoniobacterales bacterium]
MSLPIYNTHAGDKSDGLVFGMEVGNFFFIIAGAAISIFFSFVSHNLHPDSELGSLVICSIPILRHK